MRRPISLRAPSDEEGTCIRCSATVPAEELDRHFWCEDCVASAAARARGRGRLVGIGVALLTIGYITIIVKPDLSLIPAVWAGILVAAYALGARLGTEIFRAWERTRSPVKTDLLRGAADRVDGVD